ncbi:MAG: sigma-70 family RNA polymerase sigma factor [Thermoleophilaceae bacterium]
MDQTLRDPDAFGDAYRHHIRRAVLAARRVLGDDPRAEDAAQDAFLRLWRNPGGYDATRGDLGAYVSLMARSRAIDLWRSERSLERATERLGTISSRDSEPPDPEESALRDHRNLALRDAMRRLPEPQREALLLAHWGGLTMAEIAAHTHVPLGTVKGRLRLGLEKLAATFAAA